jgi:hypothetical protein
MKNLLVFTAVVEAGTGLGGLLAPSVLAQTLLGGPLEGPVALTVARVGRCGAPCPGHRLLVVAK